jgi:RpiB/LacA/LacB family sugar-phosphate isomerase
MRIAIGADHAGYELKEYLRQAISEMGHEVIDMGTYGLDRVDYPDFSRAVGEAVVHGKAERGIVLCGSGVGASIAANKIPGVRAAICHDTYSARQGVEHDDMNVLALGGRVIGTRLARELVRSFLAARFGGDEEHVRRVNKVLALEAEYGPNRH